MSVLLITTYVSLVDECLLSVLLIDIDVSRVEEYLGVSVVDKYLGFYIVDKYVDVSVVDERLSVNLFDKYLVSFLLIST